jgi:hypothetical protein
MRYPCGVFLTLLLALAVGCQGGSGGAADVKAVLTTEPDPPQVGPADLSIQLTDADGKPVRAGPLKLEGNMAHAGMKPVFAEAREEQPGRYRANLEFTMAGDWFVLIEGKLPDGRPFRKKVDVKGVQAR